MSAIELDTMSLEELKKLRKDVDAAIKSFEDRKKKAALAELEAKAAELGFNLSDLTGSAAKGRKVNPPKYRHPENHLERSRPSAGLVQGCRGCGNQSRRTVDRQSLIAGVVN